MWGVREPFHVHIKPPVLQNQHAISEQKITSSGLFKTRYTH